MVHGTVSFHTCVLGNPVHLCSFPPDAGESQVCVSVLEKAPKYQISVFPCLLDSSVWLTLEPLDSIHVKLSFLSEGRIETNGGS